MKDGWDSKTVFGRNKLISTLLTLLLFNFINLTIEIDMTRKKASASLPLM